MKTYTTEELNKILENHKHWICGDCDGWENMRANLSGANLYGANLYGADLSGADLYRANLSGADLYRANLSGANLSGANLSGANLYGANLYGADLSGADLYRANLSGADLYRANLSGANLSGANLYGANLSGANLSGANLSGANLYGANLSGANLYGANLYGADLSGADLYRANLSGAEGVPFIPMACPDTGEFTAWKKCESGIVKLLIPEDAKRLSTTGRKCRADKAVVLDIQDVDGESMDCKETRSIYDDMFIYRVGDTVTPKEPFCEDRWQECSSGIHFYINREEAVRN